ncbi:MAG: nitrilase-related carbon-nitrogen hydrolase [Armatimonadota bacterium]
MTTTTAYKRFVNFSAPLDDCWEVLPNEHWAFEMAPGCARLRNTGMGDASIFLRPCALPGDVMEFRFVPGAVRAGRFFAGLVSGFELIRVEIDLTTGALAVFTHEYHKQQPRLQATVRTGFHSLKLLREQDDLPGLPYEGCSLTVLLDDKPAARVEEIDYLPESLATFGFKGPGEASLASWSISGAPRPRPEYAHVGLWQQNQRNKATNMDHARGLVEGVRQAAEAGVRILVTPETSLTGLRMGEADFESPQYVQETLDWFQRQVAQIPNAPYTMIGYPEWVPGAQIEGATIPFVKVNRHRFVRPDGTLGPAMAKVHSCEEGLWHGREYNFQRVEGVEIAMGVCHDGHYRDVWATGVMGGARLCLHPAAGGQASGNIDDLRNAERHTPAVNLDAFWMHCNAGGPSAIIYPCPNAKIRETIIAVPKDLTAESPTYPDYSYLGDQLAHAVIRLYDATGCYPMRTLRGGSRAYQLWSQLIPPLVDV